ncbi:MAG: sigma-70 family RNA polymerase sigma factor [Pseudomonadota bacterium]
MTQATNSDMERDQREHFAACVGRIASSQCRTAFTQLFEFFAPRLKSYMRRLGADDQEAEELAQEVMVTVWRKADQYDRSKASVSTWIFRIARNRRIDAHRRNNKPALEPDEPMLQPAPAEQPDDGLNRLQHEEIVRRELATLPEEQLVLLQAAFYDGLSHTEIAKAFDLPLGTVKSRIRLAFNRLRGQLEAES